MPGTISWAHALAVIAVLCSTAGMVDGKEVCYLGYIMDTFCIERGTLLDNPKLVTLDNPDKHSVHCLVDVGRCYLSGFEVLVAPNSGKTHCRAAQLDQNGNSAALALARATGKPGHCTTCTGPTSGIVQGFKATIKGTVDPNDTSMPPILTLTSIEAFNTSGCEDQGGPTVLATCDTDAGNDVGFVLAHGSLMLISWGLLLPSGVILARCMRHRDPQWFLIHRCVQIIGVSLALAGFIIAVTKFSVFTPGYYAVAQAHGCMGVAVMTLGFLQPINAYFRPHKGKVGEPASQHRRVWEYLHKGSGWFAVFCAVPTIVVGTTLVGVAHSLSFQITYAVFFILVLTLGLLLWRDRRNRTSSKNGMMELGQNVKNEHQVVT